jgi:hypothetical protein
MGELEKLLPAELKSKATKFGNELLLPYAEALNAVAVASSQRIAVLGIESFRIRDDGLFATVSYTDYDRDIAFSGDWTEYVTALNVKAKNWIQENPLGPNHAYSLASTSEAEHQELKRTFHKSR